MAALDWEDKSILVGEDKVLDDPVSCLWGSPLPSVPSFSTLGQYSGSQSKQSPWRCLTMAIETSLLLPTSTVEMSKDHHNLSQFST